MHPVCSLTSRGGFDYLPSWLALAVTLRGFTLGVIVLSWLIRTAKIIEQQYRQCGDHGTKPYSSTANS